MSSRIPPTKLDTPCILLKSGSVRNWYKKHVKSLPDDVLVLHRCDNPPCINEDHLFLGNQSDNVNDSVNKGRWTGNTGKKHSPETKIKCASNTILTPELVKEIRNSPENNWYWVQELNVSWRCIYKVRKRLTWRHL